MCVLEIKRKICIMNISDSRKRVHLVSHHKKPVGNGDSEMEFEQGSDMRRSECLSGAFGGRE